MTEVLTAEIVELLHDVTRNVTEKVDRIEQTPEKAFSVKRKRLSDHLVLSPKQCRNDDHRTHLPVRFGLSRRHKRTKYQLEPLLLCTCFKRSAILFQMRLLFQDLTSQACNS